MEMSVCLCMIWLVSSTFALGRGQSTCIHGFISQDAIDTTLHSTQLTIPYEERRIIPGIRFNCSGVITAWTVGARWRTDEMHNVFPHLQIWRRNEFDTTYFVVGDSELSVSGSRTNGDYTFNGAVEPPLKFKSGDVLGLFQPPQSRSRIGVYYDVSRGPPNYFIDTGSAPQPPLASVIATELGSNEVQDSLPLISVNIAPDAAVNTSASGTVYVGDFSSISCWINATNIPNANYQYSITWRAQNSSEVATLTGSDSILTHNFTAQLDDAGVYSCNVSVTSPHLDRPRILSSTVNITVRRFIVRINVSYTPPPGLTLGPDEYRAASGPVIVQCMTSGGTGTITYRWSSTCRNCLFKSSTSNVIRRPAVHSGDIGTHTCTATSQFHNSSASINFNVVATGIHVFHGMSIGFHANNSLVTLHSDNSMYLLQFYCRSDSMMQNVGLLIGLDGNGIHSSNHLEVANPQPGELRVQNSVGVSDSLTTSEQGVYTCRIPQQDGVTKDINIGIYPSGFTTPPRITEFVFSPGSSSSTLTCTSTGSPATTVSWTKDGQPLTIDGGTYQERQSISNRAASTYVSVLTVRERLSDVIQHRYVCNISNTLGTDSSSLDLTAVSSITLSSDPTAGKPFSLICKVNISLALPLGEPVIAFLSPPEINNTDFIYNRSLAHVHTIKFPILRTSHGGEFTCQANFSLLTISDVMTLSVRIPSPTLIMTREPNARVALHHGDPLTLTCTIQLDPAVDPAVDSDVVVTGEISGPRGTTREVTPAAVSNRAYQMILAISSLRAAVSDTYSCTAMIRPGSAVQNVLASRPGTPSTLDVAIGLTVNIAVSYNPPPGIVLGPNEYRAASGIVNITCIALGGTGTVSFQWSSTCRNCTFQSSTSKEIIRWATHSGDIGTHTCTATDGVGNSGRGNITFNVTGAGIHVFQGQPRGSFPNNGLVIAQETASRFNIRAFCRSDSMMSNVGELIGPEGNSIHTADPFEITRPQPGELQIIVFPNTTLTKRHEGIYTCHMPLANGVVKEINIGIYPFGFINPPTITSVILGMESSYPTLTCTSTGSPATNVTWIVRNGLMLTLRDGDSMSVNMVNYQLTQTVTNRKNSTYANKLIINTTSVDDIARYRCEVENVLGSNTKGIDLGVKILANGSARLGKEYTLTCMVSEVSNIAFSIDWSLGPGIAGKNTQLSLSPLDLSDAGNYTCTATANLINLTLAASKEVRIAIPSPVVEVTHDGGSPVFSGSVLTLTCSITLDIDVLQHRNLLTVTSRWYGPRGPLTNGSGMTVAPAVASSTEDCYTSTVVLNTVMEAGSYSCQATVKHTTSQFVMDGLNTNETRIDLQIPNVTLFLTPDTTRLPNVAPYNTFSLTCTATAPEGVVSPKTFTWWRQNAVTNSNLTEVLSNDKFNIINSTLDQPVSTSVLTVTETTPGIWQFYCTVLLDDIENTSDVHSIHVTGPADPNPPTYFVASSITTHSSIICLFVPYVTFTPETYIVFYGTSITAVDSISFSVEIANFSAENFKIVFTLTSLTPSTMYFYLINASNTETSVLSQVETFETEPEQGINTTTVVVGCVVGVALLLVIVTSVVVNCIVLKRRKHHEDLSATSHTDPPKHKAEEPETETIECETYIHVTPRYGRTPRYHEASGQPHATATQENLVYENFPPRHIQTKM